MLYYPRKDFLPASEFLLNFNLFISNHYTFVIFAQRMQLFLLLCMFKVTCK